MIRSLWTRLKGGKKIEVKMIFGKERKDEKDFIEKIITRDRDQKNEVIKGKNKKIYPINK